MTEELRGTKPNYKTHNQITEYLKEYAYSLLRLVLITHIIVLFQNIKIHDTTQRHTILQHKDTQAKYTL